MSSISIQAFSAGMNAAEQERFSSGTNFCPDHALPGVNPNHQGSAPREGYYPGRYAGCHRINRLSHPVPVWKRFRLGLWWV